MCPCDLRRAMTVKIINADVLEGLSQLKSESVNCCVTSPPYWGLRDYGVEGQLGLEDTPEEYVSRMVDVFKEVKRVLKSDGTLWLNLGDSYAANRSYQVMDKKWRDVGNTKSSEVPPGLKPKDLVGIPWRVAFALQADGWYLRQDIIWHKPNPMPESVRDRCTKAHEYIFLLSKSVKYYYNIDAVREPCAEEKTAGQNSTVRSKAHLPGNKQNGRGVGCKMPEKWNNPSGRNKRSVWTIPTKPYKGAHFAVFPPDLIQPCILAGCPEGGTVLDPFMGSGTTLEVARKNGCKGIGIELNPEYVKLAKKRLAQDCLF